MGDYRRGGVLSTGQGHEQRSLAQTDARAITFSGSEQRPHQGLQHHRATCSVRMRQPGDDQRAALQRLPHLDHLLVARAGPHHPERGGRARKQQQPGHQLGDQGRCPVQCGERGGRSLHADRARHFRPVHQFRS